jgi:hypothetical protein
MRFEIKKVNQAFYSNVVVLAFFSFGTFGFFNLFGLSLIIKIIVIALTVIGFASVLESGYLKKNQLNAFLIITFFMYFGIMKTYETGSYFNGLVQGLIMVVISLFISSCDIKYITSIATKISYFIIVSSLLGIMVYFIYIINPSLYNHNSGYLMHSDIGNENIKAASILDYLSFTSGDGFEFFGTRVTRMKGYCNEPSATIVHYVGPIALILFCTRIPIALALIPIYFSLICVSSAIGMIAVFGTLFFYVLLSIKNKQTILFVLVVMILISAIALTNSNYIVNNITIYGEDIYQQTSNDLVSRKVGSAQGRLTSYNVAINTLTQYPFGGSGYSTMTGLWVDIGLTGGIILLIGFVLFLKAFYNSSIIAFNKSKSTRYKLAVALVLSIVITAILLSSYGWSRIPGVILFFLYYRMFYYNVNVIKKQN